MSASIYSAKKINITFGSHTVTGVADGTFVSLEAMGEGNTSESGAYGDVAISYDTDRRVSVKITLQQTSQTNKVFTDTFKRGRAAETVMLLPLSISDLRGKPILSAAQSYIVKMPSSDYAKQSGTREWEVVAIDADYEVSH